MGERERYDGLVHVPDFVLPFFGDETRFEVTSSVFEIAGCDFDMRRRSRQVVVTEYSNRHPTAQEALPVEADWPQPMGRTGDSSTPIGRL